MHEVLQGDLPLRLLWAETCHAHEQDLYEEEGAEPVRLVAVRQEEGEDQAEGQPLQQELNNFRRENPLSHSFCD